MVGDSLRNLHIHTYLHTLKSDPTHNTAARRWAVFHNHAKLSSATSGHSPCLSAIMERHTTTSPPTPRQLITALINTIGRLPVQEPALPATERRRGPVEPSSANPLSRADPSARSLLATLHVLFPVLLLPALDLLARQVVVRLVRVDDDAAAPAANNPSPPPPPPPPPPPVCYLVHSAAPSSTSARRGRPASAVPPYVVHVHAWSCTCATFAFAAFPPQAAARDDGDDADEEGVAPAWDARGVGGVGGSDGSPTAWEFGGVSRDGLGEADGGVGDVVPCCKHLLACMLAERWSSVLDCYVVDRTVTAQELAGIIAA